MQANPVHGSKANTSLSQNDDVNILITQMEKNSRDYSELTKVEKKTLVDSHKLIYQGMPELNQKQFTVALGKNQRINAEFKKDLLDLINPSVFFNPDNPIGQVQPSFTQNVNVTAPPPIPKKPGFVSELVKKSDNPIEQAQTLSGQSVNVAAPPPLPKKSIDATAYINTSQNINMPNPEERSITNASTNSNKNPSDVNKDQFGKVMSNLGSKSRHVVSDIKDEVISTSQHAAGETSKSLSKPLDYISKSVGNPVRYAEKYDDFYKNGKLPEDEAVESLKKGSTAIKEQLVLLLNNSNKLEFSKGIGRAILYHDQENNYAIRVKTRGSSIADNKHTTEVLVQNGNEGSAFILAKFKGKQEFDEFLQRLNHLLGLLEDRLLF